MVLYTNKGKALLLMTSENTVRVVRNFRPRSKWGRYYRRSGCSYLFNLLIQVYLFKVPIFVTLIRLQDCTCCQFRLVSITFGHAMSKTKFYIRISYCYINKKWFSCTEWDYWSLVASICLSFKKSIPHWENKNYLD